MFLFVFIVNFNKAFNLFFSLAKVAKLSIFKKFFLLKRFKMLNLTRFRTIFATTITIATRFSSRFS